MPTPKNIPMNAAIISFTSKIPVPMLKSLSTNSDNSKNKTTANVTANVRLIFKPIPVKQIPAGIKRAILSIKSRKKNHISDSSICDAIAQFRIKCDKKSNGIRLMNISMLSMSQKIIPNESFLSTTMYNDAASHRAKSQLNRCFINLRRLLKILRQYNIRSRD